MLYCHVRGTNESRKAAQLKFYLWNVERKVLGVRLSVFSQSDVQIANLFRPFESRWVLGIGDDVIFYFLFFSSAACQKSILKESDDSWMLIDSHQNFSPSRFWNAAHFSHSNNQFGSDFCTTSWHNPAAHRLVQVYPITQMCSNFRNFHTQTLSTCMTIVHGWRAFAHLTFAHRFV